MPFVSEELWQHIRQRQPKESIMRAPLATPDKTFIDEHRESEIVFVQNVIESIRNIRGEMGIAPSKEIALHMKLGDARTSESVEPYAGYFRRLARVSSLSFIKDSSRPKPSASAVVQGEELFVPLEGLIDIEVEKARLQKEIDRVSGLLKSVQAKLNNASFVDKAPKEVVEKENEKLKNFGGTIEKLQRSYDALI